MNSKYRIKYVFEGGIDSTQDIYIPFEEYYSNMKVTTERESERPLKSTIQLVQLKHDILNFDLLIPIICLFFSINNFFFGFKQNKTFNFDFSYRNR